MRAGSAGLALALVLLAAPALAEPPSTCLGFDINDFRGTDGENFLIGDPARDIVTLGAAGDQYAADGGNDIVCGNGGDDVLIGEDGDDQLNGGDGDDLLAGLADADVLYAGNGADVLRGHNGDDELRAAAADGQIDQIYDGPGVDLIVGQPNDIWHRCDDPVVDPHADFEGIIVHDPDCGS